MSDPIHMEIIEAQNSRSPHRSLSRQAQRAMLTHYEFGCLQEAHARADTGGARARVTGVAMVTQEALRRIGELSEEEARLTARTPFAEPRLRAVVDAFAVYAVSQVARGACQ